MRKLTILVLGSLIALGLWGGVAYAQEWKGKSEVKTAGNVQVEFITPAEGLKVGDNNLAVQLKDLSAGQPVVRESVRVDLLMDEADSSMKHGDMSKQEPVVVQLKAEKNAAGRYSGKANLSSAGNWKARVFVDPRGIQAPLTFNVQVDGGGPNWLVIGGLLAAIAVVVIGIAVAVRRKSAPEEAATQVLEAGEA